jgi:hypothetical protein
LGSAPENAFLEVSLALTKKGRKRMIASSPNFLCLDCRLPKIKKQ